jgi:hypothetical protein
MKLVDFRKLAKTKQLIIHGVATSYFHR